MLASNLSCYYVKVFWQNHQLFKLWYLTDVRLLVFTLNCLFKGLGKRKSVTGASQRYKDTSSLLRWSEEPRFSPVSSYRADFLSQSLPQTKIVNVSEPVHSRSHLALRRRQIRADPKALPIRTAPLLAWNVPDKSTYEKPCVGSERTRNSVFETMSRENSGKLCRQSRTCDQVAYGNNPNDSNLSHVIETVTKLDL